MSAHVCLCLLQHRFNWECMACGHKNTNPDGKSCVMCNVGRGKAGGDSSMNLTYDDGSD